MRMKSKAPTRPPANKAAGGRLDTKSPARGCRRETHAHTPSNLSRRRRHRLPLPPLYLTTQDRPPRMTDPDRFPVQGVTTRRRSYLARKTPHAEGKSSLWSPEPTRVIS